MNKKDGEITSMLCAIQQGFGIADLYIPLRDETIQMGYVEAITVFQLTPKGKDEPRRRMSQDSVDLQDGNE